MKITEVYINKEEGNNSYEIQNKIGLGIQKLVPVPLRGGLDITREFKVFVNDKELEYMKDYIIEGFLIIFSNPLEISDKVRLEDSILNNVKIITKNPYAKNALLKMFTSETKLKFNHKYSFDLVVNDEEFNSSFYSKYDPFLTTINKVRSDTGDLLENTPDEVIARVIYYNSKDAMDRLGDTGTTDDIPKHVKNIVRYKTDIDLCYSFYLSATGKGGSFAKKIGDLDIKSSVRVPRLKEMLSRFKDLLKPNEDLITGESVTAISYVKASGSEYPVASRGVF